MAQLNDLIVIGKARFLNTINGTITNATCATNASCVNGKTVATNVPSGAVFTDTKVTSVDNHYTPSTNNASSLTASATAAIAAWSIDVVKGVTLSRDAKGHVTGISVTSGKIPANPNTDHLYYAGTGLKASTSGNNTTFGVNTTYAFNLGAATVAKAGTATNADTATYATSAGSATDSTKLPLAGGTMTGTIITPKDDNKGLEPFTDKRGQVGSASRAYYRMHSNYYYAQSISLVTDYNSQTTNLLISPTDITLSAKWDGTNSSLKTALASVVTYQDFTCTAATVSANSSKQFATVNVAKTGYTPIAIVKYNTGDGSITPVNLYLEGTSAILVLRNVSSSAKSVTPTFRILYMKSS
jgi:hypothetical protein